MVTLQRQLAFTDRHEVAEYIHGSLLNKELYKAFLANRDNCYRWKHSPVETFNELYYQCTRVYNDPNPESEVYYNYLNNARDNLGQRYASDMIFAMVNAMFIIMDNKPENVEFFQSELQAHLKNETCFYQQYTDFANEFVRQYGKQILSFPYCPVSLSKITGWDADSWKECTKDFDEYYIRKYVNRYSNTEDKLQFIDLIEKAYNETLRKEEEESLIEDLPF